jgi:DNA-binding MarR family transcriptional regulator
LSLPARRASRSKADCDKEDAMSVPRNSSRRAHKAAASRKLFLAQKALTMSAWKWFDGAGICRTCDEFDIMPRMLVGLYLAHKEGKQVSKSDLYRLMKVDRNTTGPSYMARAVERGLVTIEKRPAEDRRKDLVVPTESMLKLVEAELQRTARLLLYLISPRRRRR